MITLETIKSIISGGEGHNTEFKTSFGQEVVISLNAFANTDGGTILIGVDNDGQITGVTLSKESIVSWINEVRSKTEPAIIPDADEFTIDGKTIVALSIREFPVKPVAVKGRYYRRIKNSNHQLRLSEISEMYLKTFNSSWDYYIDEQHSLDDISLDKIIAFSTKSVTSSVEDDPLRLLQKYELMRNGHITKAAYLLFVKDFTALTGIQIGRFKSPTKIIDAVSFHSDLFTEVEQVLAFVRKYFMVEYIITGHARREERYDYPEEAIREIVLNMIVHRDYRDSGDSIIKIFDDRMEFFNPGNLTDGLTVEHLLSDAYTPKARNKLINLLFKEAGLVEKYGSGVRRIMQACEKHGKCNVEFFSEQHGFKVVVSKTGLPTNQNSGMTAQNSGMTGGMTAQSSGMTSDLTLSQIQQMIINLMKENPQISYKKLAETIKINISALQKHVEKLKQKGIIQRFGADFGGKWIITNKDLSD
jgi:ATP-dependent DNA helicase RecG